MDAEALLIKLKNDRAFHWSKLSLLNLDIARLEEYISEHKK